MKIENKLNNVVYVTGDNYIIVIPVKSTNVLCPDNARNAYLLDTEGNKIEYIFGNMKNATYGYGHPEPTRLELAEVMVNGKSSWTIGEKYHKHVPCNVDKIADCLACHYEDEFLGAK